MTKRFEVYKVIGSFHEWSIEDKITDKVVFGSIMDKYEADRLCEKLNELNDEIKQLKFQLKECREHKLYSRRELEKENEQLKQQLAHHTRMHEWFRNEAYLLQNKLDNREDEIRRLKGDVE